MRFTLNNPGADRVHYLTEADVRVVLTRLPVDELRMPRTVHFNDHSRGGRCLGYANCQARAIALCALPPRMSLRQALLRGQSAEEFGASLGQWPELAIRRFLLYDVFLHEVGHLQIVSNTKDERLRFAREPLAEDFANSWRAKLWSERYDHPDPVHNRALPEEYHA